MKTALVLFLFLIRIFLNIFYIGVVGIYSIIAIIFGSVIFSIHFVNDKLSSITKNLLSEEKEINYD